MAERSKTPEDADGADDKRVRAANEKGRMGPGEVAGGYGSQRFDVDRHGGTYGSNVSAGGSYVEQNSSRGNAALSGGNGVRDPLADRGVLHGQQHMSGVYGGQAYGRLDGEHANIPHDPTQLGARPADGASPAGTGGAQPPDAGQNAMIAGGSEMPPIGRGTENERTSPGMSTDKKSDDTKS
jgi:hypothetical protein